MPFCTPFITAYLMYKRPSKAFKNILYNVTNINGKQRPHVRKNAKKQACTRRVFADAAFSARPQIRPQKQIRGAKLNRSPHSCGKLWYNYENVKGGLGNETFRRARAKRGIFEV